LNVKGISHSSLLGDEVCHILSMAGLGSAALGITCPMTLLNSMKARVKPGVPYFFFEYTQSLLVFHRIELDPWCGEAEADIPIALFCVR